MKKRKTSALAVGQKVAADHKQVAVPLRIESWKRGKVPAGLVLVGAHFTPQLRRGLKFMEAETGKTLKALLGEAINDLCAKYGKPELYGSDNVSP